MNLVRYEPDHLLKKYHSIRREVSTDVFYSKPRFRKVMELWCAAQFARGYSENVRQCAVWVPEGKREMYFDFQLEVGEQRRNFQLREVLSAGRRRGDEYREGGPPTCTTVDEWDRGRRCGGDWIVSAIRGKHSLYAGDVADLDLLLYLNYVAVEHSYVELRDRASADAATFRSVWLLNGNAIACIAGKDEGQAMQHEWMFLPREEACET
ncbi:MAG: hypothetical protein IPL15_08335 [Comamonadaceae bacterium]|jgi:hypothetical protein|uniref:hypothetical protein n=1 Tax=Candidatus Skiveiella danica TaxID=3386177 RepID=UPI001DCE3103|nr:hypothetical protein [Comamonadaceae bacterium]MBK6556597.1 hypothetical protein [Comamonadaceae bacterium]MBK7510601.1 hypothetical protein [Comamonadaceae bacterium]MBK8358977.1 hypothetical protein [Comamonadaceae bacterium]MBK9199343.1 hypothetical protein [Betaproteobacteria bacterium]